ncbi:uncharacterized protein OCT59_025462 [Rhizophagus irregularis]|nr:hypothetical protein RirG_189850 [Rhizophagus irregularis DAOM 197198w]UZO05101.1 hypothetical protein OCT59_025462 [Rhizophagus irregularis]GBC11475.1 hypothetical protein GLOIN_2v1684593 [Rhizophagus irregularis DAOM 181602=DAOM 197198]CAB4398888.1 unnamed protein product [Rhizophagus irregularis]CAB5364417.1 unnamed protein product [Rhizophagus irregularis]
MASDLTLAIMLLSVCLWILVTHIQSPVELLLQLTINENNSMITVPDNNNNTYLNLYQEDIPIGCKVTKVIKSKFTNDENEIGIINFSQFPNGIIQVSGEINNVTRVTQHDVSNLYFEIEDFDDDDKGAKGASKIVIGNDNLFINKREGGIINFIFVTKLISIDNKCNLNQNHRRIRKNVIGIGKKFVVYIKNNDELH